MQKAKEILRQTKIEREEVIEKACKIKSKELAKYKPLFKSVRLES